LDLACVAKFSATHRQQLLTLSQHGGHPRIWNATSASVFAVIKELTEKVKDENWSIMSKVSISSQRTGAFVYQGQSFLPFHVLIFVTIFVIYSFISVTIFL
jgi:hypothetical protein